MKTSSDKAKILLAFLLAYLKFWKMSLQGD